ncbi:MAG: L-2-amino-thiazoline-4-carboxylic acid hydrolase [Candidatus Thorarchaeota archaeon]|nr:L-2-amino-thiazoline-4-carboxylic acid hydrolase [Candidatus Thorarchaeota archaeon]
MSDDELNNIDEQLEAFTRSEKRHLKEKFLLLRAMETEFGERVREIIRMERSQSVRSQWEYIGTQVESNSIESLIEILWTPMRQRRIVEYEYGKTKDNGICIKVTRCLFAELVNDLEIPSEWGYDLYCSDDEHMVRGFNSKMEFSRSKTLMQGHECCNHCYRMI